MARKKKRAPKMETDKTTPEERMRRAEAEISDLDHMTVGLLQVKWLQVFKERAKSRNKRYLIKRIAYRLQEIAEGGLSERAKKRLEELAKDAPLRQRPPRAKTEKAESGETKAATPRTATSVEVKAARDPRLPPVGGTLRKMHQGTEHVVRVRADGFEYKGRKYGSLSAVAKEISGQVWNGFGFFGLLAKKVA
jgi:hypothetical protein